MAAVKSQNRTDVYINQNFIIQVAEYIGKQLVFKDEQTDEVELIDVYSEPKITSANRIIKYVKDEKLKIKLFKKLLESKKQKHTMMIRKRLRINIWSK